MTERFTEEGTSRYVTAGEHRVHYHEAGEGPVIVMLHGSSPGAGGWVTWSSNLPAYTQRHRVLLLDLLGFGRSAKPRIAGEYLRFQADAVEGVLDALGIERAAFVGLSLGGGAALRLALDSPERVSAMVLLSPLGVIKRIDRFSGLQNVFRKVVENPDAEHVAELMRGFVARPELITPELIADRFARFDDPEAIAATKDMSEYYADLSDENLRGLELWRDVAHVEQDTLLVVGRDDRIAGAVDGVFDVAKSFPNGHVWMMPNAAHWPQFEQREMFDAHSLIFLEQATSSVLAR